MSGLEVIVGLSKLTIHQCQSMAKQLDFDGATFDLCGPEGRIPARWLDAYMGIFELEGQDGFVMVKQFEFTNVWCENLRANEAQS